VIPAVAPLAERLVKVPAQPGDRTDHEYVAALVGVAVTNTVAVPDALIHCVEELTPTLSWAFPIVGISTVSIELNKRRYFLIGCFNGVTKLN
jgi:hypothetical protein